MNQKDNIYVSKLLRVVDFASVNLPGVLGYYDDPDDPEISGWGVKSGREIKFLSKWLEKMNGRHVRILIEVLDESAADESDMLEGATIE